MPPSKLTSLPPTDPFASAVRSSSGSWSPPLLWNGQETLTSTLPPSSPLTSTLTERSRSALSIPSKLAPFRTASGLSSELPLSLPPQAANTVASPASAAQRRRVRSRLKVGVLLGVGQTGGR